MKKRLFLLLCVVACSISIHSQSEYPISRDKAWEIVKNNILDHQTEGINLYACDTITFAGSCIKTILTDEYSPLFDSWFFFIDDVPNANWEHPCRYVFINIDNGKYEIYDRVRPPLMDGMKIFNNNKLNTCSDLSDTVQIQQSDHNNIVSTVPYQNDHNYAIIINGGIDKYNNHVRYWNDCSYIYKTLINTYHYKKNNIFVLMSDGTSSGEDRCLGNMIFDSSPLDLDEDGYDDIQYAATPSNIHSVFTTLSNTLTQADTLFIFTMDHGGQTSGNSVYLYLWGSTISDEDFAAEVNSVNAGKIIICMGQCHSGGFIDDLQAPNRVIMTACKYDEFSYTTNFIYDEFVFHWNSAINGSFGADLDADGKVSMYEAFEYATNNDVTSETPQYLSLPFNLGNTLTLSNFFVEELEGNNTIYETNSYKFKLISPYISVNWILTGDNAANFILEANTPTVNKCRITRIESAEFIGSEDLTLTAQILYGGTIIGNISKELKAPFISGPMVPCGYSTYIVEGRPSNYTVEWEASGENLEYDTDPYGLIPSDPYAYVIIHNANETHFGTLTANVKYGNNVEGVLHKTIDTAGGFAGTWYQQATLNDTVNSTPMPFSNMSMLEIVPNRKVYLQSDHFIGATITHSQNGILINDWSNNNGVISFTPIVALGMNGVMSVQGTVGCKKYRLSLYTLPSRNVLSLNSNGDIYEFSIAHNGEKVASSNKWHLAIMKINTGNKVFDETVMSNSKIVNISGWSSGIYVALAQVDGQYYSLKFSVGEWKKCNYAFVC